MIKAEGKKWFIHESTKNESFKLTRDELIKKKVKNCHFMLALFDETLENVDPLSDDLDLETKKKISRELARNPWYWFREVCMIPVPGGKVKFELHQGNLFSLWCHISNINFFLMLPRQHFKTVSSAAFYAWVYLIRGQHCHMLFFNKQLKDSINNLKRVMNIIQELPKWLTEAAQSSNDIDNTTKKEIKLLDNFIEAKPPGTSAEHADLLGRGATTPLQWYDEIAFIKFIQIIYEAAIMAVSKACVLAEQMGVPYGVAITTTPNTLDDPSGAFAYSIFKGSLKFDYSFYDLGSSKVKELLKTVDNSFVYGEFSYKELRKDDEWLKSQEKELLGNLAKLKREVLLEWPMTSENSVFSEEQLSRIKKYQKDVLVKIPINVRNSLYVPDGLTVNLTREILNNKKLLIGLDTAEGAGLDYTAFSIIDPDDMHCIGGLRNNKISDDGIIELTEHIMKNIFPYSIFVVERNVLGKSILKRLLRIDGLENRFFYIDKESITEVAVSNSIKSKATKKTVIVREYGVNTTNTSREAMMRSMMDIVTNMPEYLEYSDLQDEIRTLERNKNGKIQAKSGFHDDQLMSTLLVYYADRIPQSSLRTLLNFNSGDESFKIQSYSSLNTSELKGEILTRRAESINIEDYINKQKEKDSPEQTKVRVGFLNIISDLNK